MNNPIVTRVPARVTLADAVATVAAVVAASVLLLAGYTTTAAGAAEEPPCSGVQINPGDDLDAIVNNDPGSSSTTFCVHAAASGTTYSINSTVVLGPGDELVGDPGQVVTRGPASYGVPLVKIRNGAAVEQLIALRGSNRLSWLDIAGGASKHYQNGEPVQGTGTGIRSGSAGATTLMEYLAVHDNDGQGIGTMQGKLLHSELYNNGTDPAFWGFTAAAVKGIDEYEAAHNYVHDNPAIGLWCDHGCRDEGSAMPNGFWAHHNLIVDNGRYGVHYEFSPIIPSGEHSSQPTALVENNEIHGNGYRGGSGYAGAAMRDSQNGTFRSNAFGPKTIAGVDYRANVGNRAIHFVDSGRAERTDLWNGEAAGNVLNGETIIGCEKPDNVVDCANAPADTTAPTATIDSKPAAQTDDGTPSFGFSSNEANSSFKCSLSTGADTFESCTPPKHYAARPDGSYTFKVSATDAAGNTGEAASYAFEIDAESVTPAVPSAPDLLDTSDTGLSQSDDSTGDATPSFSGTAEADSKVEIVVDGALEGSGVATDNGYSITVSQLALGTHTVQARATGSAGGVSDPSGPLDVQIVEATTCHTAANRITGTEAPDNITGTTAADQVFGLGGTDTLAGLAGADCLSGGPSDAQSQDDTLQGGEGNDELVGGSGHDRIYGGPGKDLVRSGWGKDSIDSVDATADRIDCGGGKDTASVDHIDAVVDCEAVSRK